VPSVNAEAAEEVEAAEETQAAGASDRGGGALEAHAAGVVKVQGRSAAGQARRFCGSCARPRSVYGASAPAKSGPVIGYFTSAIRNCCYSLVSTRSPAFRAKRLSTRCSTRSRPTGRALRQRCFRLRRALRREVPDLDIETVPLPPNLEQCAADPRTNWQRCRPVTVEVVSHYRIGCACAQFFSPNSPRPILLIRCDALAPLNVPHSRFSPRNLKRLRASVRGLPAANILCSSCCTMTWMPASIVSVIQDGIATPLSPARVRLNLTAPSYGSVCSSAAVQPPITEVAYGVRY